MCDVDLIACVAGVHKVCAFMHVTEYDCKYRPRAAVDCSYTHDIDPYACITSCKT